MADDCKMSEFEKAVKTLVDTFDKYASTDDKKDELSLEELKKLFEEQITCQEVKDKLNDGKLEQMKQRVKRRGKKGCNDPFKVYLKVVSCMMKKYRAKKNDLPCDSDDDE